MLQWQVCVNKYFKERFSWYPPSAIQGVPSEGHRPRGVEAVPPPGQLPGDVRGPGAGQPRPRICSSHPHQ